MELVAARQIGNRHDRILVKGFDDELDTVREPRVRAVWENCLRTNVENECQNESID